MIHNKLQAMRISKKISLTHSLLFLAIQMLMGSILLLSIRLYYPIEAKHELRKLSDQVSKQLISDQGIDQANLSENLLCSLPAKYQFYLAFKDENGTLLWENGYTDIIPISDEITVKPVLLKHNGKEILYQVEKIRINKEQLIICQSIIDITASLAFNSTLFRILLILTVVGFMISFFTGNIVGRIVLSPITKMTESAKQINARHLNVRIETSATQDELSELGNTMNDMIVRLQAAFEDQERLISDISHEMKTPIAVIKGYSSLLMRWGMDDRAVFEEAVMRIDQESVNMGRMVEDMLMLAKKDNNSLIINREETDLGHLIQEVVSDTRICKPQCDIETSCEEGCIFNVDVGLIRQLLRILIDNAIQYSKEECRIRITCEKEDKQIRIAVQDWGIGIPKEDLEKVFERFYRADSSRPRTQGGTGLGLSIAKAITEAHNGTIFAQSDSSGTIFTCMISARTMPVQ